MPDQNRQPLRSQALFQLLILSMLPHDTFYVHDLLTVKEMCQVNESSNPIAKVGSGCVKAKNKNLVRVNTC